MTDGDRRMQARAVFLAAIMVVSMLAVPMAFAGTAAAEYPSPEFNLDEIDSATFEQGETVEDLTAGVADFGDGYDESTNYTVAVNATDPNNANVSLIDQDGFEVDEDDFVFETQGSEIDAELVETTDEGVFAVKLDDQDEFVSGNGTVAGDTLNNATSGNVTMGITVDDEATLGTYNFTADVVEVTDDPDDDEWELGESEGSETADFDIETNRVIEPDPEEVLNNQVTEVDVAIENHPEDVNAEYTVEVIGSDFEIDGTTRDDGTFTFFADATMEDVDAGDTIDITVEYDFGDVEGEVTVVPELNLTVDRDVDEPEIGDRVEFSGTFLDGEGDSAGDEFQLDLHIADNETIDNATQVRDFVVAGDGSFVGDLSLPDAGNYTFVANDTAGQHFELEEGQFLASSEEGDLTFEANETPRANDGAFQYNATLNDSEDEGVEVEYIDDPDDGEVAGFVQVTGNFSGETVSDVGSGAIVKVVVNGTELEDDLDNVDGDDTVTEIHGNTSAAGEFQFEGEATEPGEIEASLAVLEEYDADLDDLEIVEGGVEYGEFFTLDTLDLVAPADTQDVEALGDLNVDIETTPDELNVNATGDNEIEVTVTGEDNLPPGDDAAINSSNVTLTSEDYDIEQEIVLNDSEPATATFEDLEFDQAGTLTITVEAFDDEEELINETEETIEVDGDILVDIDPTAVTAEEEENVTIQITDADGDDVTDRTLTLSGDPLDTDVTIGPGDLEDLNPSTYVGENIEFETPGDVDLTVTDDAGDDTIVADEVITVTGEERYEFRTDDELLATATDNATLEVFNLADDAIENDSEALEGLADDLSLEQDGEDVEFEDASVEDEENGTIAVTDIEVEGVEQINATATFDDAFDASGVIDVEEPVVETDLGDDVLTEGVTTEDIEITATDPRDDEPLANGTVRFEANGTDFDVNGTDVDDGGNEQIELDANGEAVVNATPDVIDDAVNTTLAIDAQVEEAAVSWAGQIDIDADNMQMFERVDRDDDEVRDEIEVDFEDEITFIVRDANDDRVSDVSVERSVNVTGDGVEETFEIDETTESIFTVDFDEDVELDAGGTIEFNVSSDYADGATNITAETIEVTDVVDLTIEIDGEVVDEFTATEGDDVEFAVIRDDIDDFTSAQLTFVNESGDGDVVKEVDQPADPADVTIDLEPGDYEVIASKETTAGGTSFANDTVDLTVEEAPSSEIDVDVVSVEPDEEGVEATYTVDFTYTEVEDETAQFISVDFGTEDVNFSAVTDDADNVAVTDAEGDDRDVADVLDLDDQRIVIQLDDGDGIESAEQLDETFTVEVDEVVNAEAGEYDLTLGLHEEGDEVLDAAAAAFAADTDTYEIDPEVEPAEFELSDLDAPDEVDAGEAFDVSVTVTNTGDETDTQNVTATVNDVEVASEEVTLEGGENVTLTLEDVTIDQAGEYELVVASEDDEVSDTISVVDVDPPAVSIDDQQTDGTAVNVTEAFAPQDYVVVIHDEEGDIIGSSDVIDADEEVENLFVDLDEPLEEDQEVTAMLHEAPEDDEEDFGEPIAIDDEIVEDTAQVEVNVGLRYVDEDGTIPGPQVLEAFGDFQTGEISGPQFLEVFGAWQAGEELGQVGDPI